jgi:hypothetical protein
MNEMKQLLVRDYSPNEIGWGVDEGREVHERLKNQIANWPACIVLLNIAGLRQADVSFSREAIVETVRRFRPGYQFVIANPENGVVVENLDAAFARRDDAVVLRERGDTTRIIGKQPSSALRLILETVQKFRQATSREVVKKIPNLTIQNCSNKLKELWQAGLLYREETAAQTGGREWKYSSLM